MRGLNQTTPWRSKEKRFKQAPPCERVATDVFSAQIIIRPTVKRVSGYPASSLERRARLPEMESQQLVRKIEKNAGLADSGLPQHQHRPRPALDRVEDRSRFRPLDTGAGYVTNP